MFRACRIKTLWGYLEDGVKVFVSRKIAGRRGIKFLGEILARVYHVLSIRSRTLTFFFFSYTLKFYLVSSAYRPSYYFKNLFSYKF